MITQLASADTTVLVVGAGPTGLLLATELLRRGVPTQLIDSRAEALHWDRATVVHPRSLEIFASLGLLEPLLTAGCRQRRILIHAGGQRLGELDLADCGSLYGFNLGLSEEVTEAILTGHLERQGGSVERGCRLVGLTPHDDGVVAEIEHNGARRRLATRWLVGCDGLRSATRNLSGIAFDGQTIAQPWAVFDAGLPGWTETHEANLVFLNSSPLILTALPNQRWRVYLRPSSEEADLVQDASAALQHHAPGLRFNAVENPTRFRCHTKVARSFRAGPVFLAGDAAHVCTPAEGHGMNCGLQDAANLAWKLALVHHGAAPEPLLASYELERRPVAEMITRSGEATERMHLLAGTSERAARDRAIAAMLADPRSRQHEVVAETELNVDYTASPITSGGGSLQLAPGQRLPTTIRLAPGSCPAHLHEHTHRPGHTVLLLGSASSDPEVLARLQTELEALRSHSPIVDSVVSLRLDNAAELGLSCHGPGELTLLAVRPDGFIGLRADSDHSTALMRYERLLLGT